ncbi:hypothetical protein NC651_020196 [Populus alba x Populus x berolinensis]|nr:hypothetical protein NC651_020196 [Populus alba x Populus x berolinensis]
MPIDHVAECTVMIAQVLEHLISSASQQMHDKSTPPRGQPNKHAGKITLGSDQFLKCLIVVLKFLPVGQKVNNWTTTTKADASSALLHALMVFFWAAPQQDRTFAGLDHGEGAGAPILIVTVQLQPVIDHRWRNLVDGPAIPLTGRSSNESNLNLLSSTVACFDIPNWTLWSRPSSCPGSWVRSNN